MSCFVARCIRHTRHFLFLSLRANFHPKWPELFFFFPSLPPDTLHPSPPDTLHPSPLLIHLLSVDCVLVFANSLIRNKERITNSAFFTLITTLGQRLMNFINLDTRPRRVLSLSLSLFPSFCPSFPSHFPYLTLSVLLLIPHVPLSLLLSFIVSLFLSFFFPISFYPCALLPFFLPSTHLYVPLSLLLIFLMPTFLSIFYFLISYFCLYSCPSFFIHSVLMSPFLSILVSLLHPFFHSSRSSLSLSFFVSFFKSVRSLVPSLPPGS